VRMVKIDRRMCVSMQFRKNICYTYIRIIYSVTTRLSILFSQKFLHSKRELQHIAFDADSLYFFKCLHNFHAISGFDL